MNQAYIVDALRSPTGKRKGGLSHVHAIDLGAHVLKALVEESHKHGKKTACHAFGGDGLQFAINAGCAFCVSVRASIPPSQIKADSFSPSASSTSSNTAFAAG